MPQPYVGDMHTRRINSKIHNAWICTSMLYSESSYCLICTPFPSGLQLLVHWQFVNAFQKSTRAGTYNPTICAMWRKSGLATWDYLTVLHKKIIHLIWGVKNTSVTQHHNNNNGTCISTLYVRTSFKKSLARKLILFHVKQVCRISYTEKTNGFF